MSIITQTLRRLGVRPALFIPEQLVIGAVRLKNSPDPAEPELQEDG